MKERKRRQKAKRYAAEFFAKLKEDNQHLFAYCTLPKVICCRRFAKDSREDEDGKKIFYGPVVEGEATKEAIYLYGFARQKPERLKENIRHELIHTALLQAGLPSKDDNILFLLLATDYDAFPYKILEKPELMKAQQNNDLTAIKELILSDLASVNLREINIDKGALSNEIQERSATQ